MNWKSLQKDKDILVSHVHPPLWVSTAQSRKRKEMDSVASSSLNETLLGLRQRLSPVSGRSLCSGLRQMGTSGTDHGCAAHGAAQPCFSHARPGLRLLCPCPGWDTGSLHRSRLSNLWLQVGANTRCTGTCCLP